MRFNHRLLHCLGAMVLALGMYSPSYANIKTINLEQEDGIIVNPGIGIESFQGDWGQPLTLAQYPETGVGYYRFYWNELEPEEGQYNFALIDKLIKQNNAAMPQRRLSLRFMALDGPSSGSKIPDWLIAKGIGGQWVGNDKTFVPDLEDLIYREYVTKLLAAFGQRYDGNPNLAHIDIGMVGAWGEWHYSNFPELMPLQQQYSTEILNSYVDLFFKTFPKTHKLMLINGGPSFTYAVEKGAGWRADCLGDWHNFSHSWSHMAQDYPSRIAATKSAFPGFSQLWQHAPVSFEICGDMQGWLQKQHYTRAQVQAAFDWALEQHVSSINLKSKPIPSQYRDIVDSALKKIGFRFRVKTLSYTSDVAAGDSVTLEFSFINEGVAPSYEDYFVSARLVDRLSGQVVTLVSSKQSTRRWTPGIHTLSLKLSTPKTSMPSSYNIEFALISNNGRTKLALANKGRQNSGWYRLEQAIVHVGSVKAIED